MFKNNSNPFVKIIFGLLFVAALAGCGYYYMQYTKLKADPAIQAKQESDDIIANLSKIMLFPSDANPVLAKVLDKSKLADQPFFKNAQNGDSVVILPTESEAVLYRQSINKIIAVAPLSTQQGTEESTQQTMATKAKAKLKQ